MFIRRATTSLALPVFVVTMASQNLPGVAATGVLTAFPRELVVAIAGLALLGSLGGSLAVALAEEPLREAALITFFVTLSSLSSAGIGSAFLGRARRRVGAFRATVATSRSGPMHHLDRRFAAVFRLLPDCPSTVTPLP